jgi:hypothetical protein
VIARDRVIGWSEKTSPLMTLMELICTDEHRQEVLERDKLQWLYRVIARDRVIGNRARSPPSPT